MPTELTSNQLNNIKAAIDFLRRLQKCCPGLRANGDFVSAFQELEKSVKSDKAIREWWKAGDEETESEAEIDRRLWVLWVKYIWIRPDILAGNRLLDLANCDGKEIAKLAFIMLHEAYHVDGWVDGENLARQDLQNLSTWELNLISLGPGIPPHCPNFPCANKVLEFVKARMAETVTTINNLPWYKSRWFNFNWISKWLFRYAISLAAVVIGALIIAVVGVLIGIFGLLAEFTLAVILIIALIITLIWGIIEAIFA
jgi:hypothetical protein